MNGTTNMLFSTGTAMMIVMVLSILLFILGLCVCFAIISMSNSLKDIRNLYFRIHWEDVEKARREDAMERTGIDQNETDNKI